MRAFGLHRPDRTPCGMPLPVSEAHALLELARHGPLNSTELAKRLQLEKSTVSRIVGKLEGRGWVQRIPHEGDGRVTLLELTAAGRKAEAVIAEARRHRLAALLDRVPAAEREPLLRALDTLVRATLAEER